MGTVGGKALLRLALSVSAPAEWSDAARYRLINGPPRDSDCANRLGEARQRGGEGECECITRTCGGRDVGSESWRLLHVFSLALLQGVTVTRQVATAY